MWPWRAVSEEARDARGTALACLSAAHGARAPCRARACMYVGVAGGGGGDGGGGVRVCVLCTLTLNQTCLASLCAPARKHELHAMPRPLHTSPTPASPPRSSPGRLLLEAGGAHHQGCCGAHGGASRPGCVGWEGCGRGTYGWGRLRACCGGGEGRGGGRASRAGRPQLHACLHRSWCPLGRCSGDATGRSLPAPSTALGAAWLGGIWDQGQPLFRPASTAQHPTPPTSHHRPDQPAQPTHSPTHPPPYRAPTPLPPPPHHRHHPNNNNNNRCSSL